MKSRKLKKPSHFLTLREFETLEIIVLGYSNHEIASTLFLSVETVKSHRRGLMRKLDVHNVAGIVREAFCRKLVEVENFKSPISFGHNKIVIL